MDPIWFSTSAAELAQRYGVAVEDPTDEGRYTDLPVPDWEAIGTALRRLFGLAGPVVAGANPQGQPTQDAIDTVTAELGETDTEIVEYWLRFPPPVLTPAGTNSAAAAGWGVRDGRHRLTGVWSVHPEWQLPVMWDIPDPDDEGEPDFVRNQAIDNALQVDGDLASGHLQLPDSQVNTAFTARVRDLAQRPRHAQRALLPRGFTWTGPDPEIFLNGEGFTHVFAWPQGDELLLVVQSTATLGRESIHSNIVSISNRAENERLAELLRAAEQATVLGPVTAPGGVFWQAQTLSTSEIRYGRELPKSRPWTEKQVGDVTWTSTIENGRESNE